MQLQATQEYGLRCLLQVAGSADAQPVSISPPVSIAQIAAAEGLSPEYAAKLLRRLRLGGLVTSVRGAEGGYRLARPATEISVWDALEVMGGEFFPEGFCSGHCGNRRRCARSSDCALRALWRRVQETLRATLSQVSIADLGRDERAMVTWLDAADASQLLPVS